MASWIRRCSGTSCCRVSSGIIRASSTCALRLTRKSVQALQLALACFLASLTAAQVLLMSASMGRPPFLSSGSAFSFTVSTLASAELTRLESSFSRPATSSSCLCLCLSSSALCSAATRRRSPACVVACSASSRIRAWLEPQLAHSRIMACSSSALSEAKFSSVARRTRWMTLRTMRAAACSVRLASSSSRFRRSSVCRRCISSSRSCCRRLMSSSRFFRSASFWAISTSCLCLRWSTMPPGGCAAQGCAGMTLGPVLGPMRSRRDSSTGPSQGTFQPLVGGRGEFLLTL
mmetsp:Transcript_52649/g.159582  ORF Transcript_52649/g.159582 Transcript_52649/m.159582 type:complete len:290 (-) Transcript_52649:325-1194(-)